jgi:hypothetical protein
MGRFTPHGLISRRLLRNQSNTFGSFLDSQSMFKLIFSRACDTERMFSPRRFVLKNAFT